MADQHVVLLGPIKGVITLDDGTEYDVNGDRAVVASPEHAAELADKVGDHYEKHGHPHHDADKPFRHTKRKG